MTLCDMCFLGGCEGLYGWSGCIHGELFESDTQHFPTMVYDGIGEIGMDLWCFFKHLIPSNCFANGAWAAWDALSMLLTVCKSACIYLSDLP